MINVVHLITSLDTGGAEIMLARLVENMDRKKFFLTVICLTRQGKVGERIVAAGIPVIFLDMPRGRPSVRGLFRLWKHLREIRPNILQTWLYHSDLIGLLTGRLASIRNIVWNIRCSVTDERYHKGFNGLIVKLLARFSGWPKAVIVNSRAGQEIHEMQGYRPRRWVYLPNGVQTNLFSPDVAARKEMRASLSLGSQDFVVGLAGRYDPLKNHKLFIEAALVFSAANHNAKFVLVGFNVDQNNAVLTQQIAESGLEDKFLLLGERIDMPEITRIFDVATCSSLGEGFPTVIAEAMASGVPCVSTNVGEAATIVGDYGHIVPVKNAAELASGWQKVSTLGDEEYDALSTKCRSRIVSNYSLDTVTRQYERLYAEITLD
jgi:glycosyltransferase involved in cell wall biosynthesis